MTVQIATRQLNRVALDGFDVAARRVVREAGNQARRRAPVRSGEYRSSFLSRKCGPGVWGFGNAAEHAPFLELGTRPYPYSPGQNVPMNFGSGVEYRFLGTRDGIRANPVLQESVDRAIRRVL